MIASWPQAKFGVAIFPVTENRSHNFTSVKVLSSSRYGMPHGRVEWQLPSGLRMDGMFRMGRPHGFVRVYDDKGSLVFEGR